MAEIDRTQLFGYADIDKINVELEMLDFDYVEKCNDWKILMKILDVLRSGKEGHFPELMRKTEEVLMSVLPAREKKRYLAVFSQPSVSEAETAQDEILKWATSTTALDSSIRNGKLSEREEPSWTVEKFKSILNQAQFSKLKDIEEHLQCLSISNLKRVHRAEIERRKGNDFFKAKDYDTAINYYTNSIVYHPVSESSWTNRAICYIKKEVFDYAEGDCSVALLLNSNSVKALVRRGISRLSAGKYRQAAFDFLQGSTLEPANVEIAKLLSKAKEKYEEVEGKPLNLNPSSSISSSVSVQYVDLRSDLLVPNFVLTHRSSQILRKKDETNSADQQFVRIEIENASDSEEEEEEEDFDENEVGHGKDDTLRMETEAEKLKEEANKLVVNGFYNEALQIYDLSLEKKFSVAVLNNRAQAKMYLKDFHGAIRDLTEVLSHEKENLKALFRRAKAFYELGEFNLSKQDLTEFLRLDPHHAEAQNFEANLDAIIFNQRRSEELKNEGNLQMKDQNYNLALHSYTEAITLNPSNAQALSNRSLVYLKLGKYEEAEIDASSILAQFASRTDDHAIQLIRKALYRRAMARLEISKLSSTNVEILNKSYSDALELVRSDPKNEQAQKLSAEILDLLKQASSKKAVDLKPNPIPLEKESVPEPAKTFYEFERVWKSLKSSPTARFRYFLSFKKPQFKKVFKTALSSEILADIIEVYADPSTSASSSALKIFTWLFELPSIEFSFMMISSETNSSLEGMLKKFSEVEGFGDVSLRLQKLLKK